MRLLLVNPNSNVGTTAMMVARAQESAPAGTEVIGETAVHSPPLMFDPTRLAAGAREVERLAEGFDARGVDGVIVAAFGDPGLAVARTRTRVPVTGIAEAAILAAVRFGRFAIVTTTPQLEDAIAARVAACGAAEHFTGCVFTHTPAERLGADAAALEAELEAACVRALALHHPQAIVIGGGPLAAAAQVLAPRLPVPVIEPVPEAVRLALQRAHEALR